ncbi:MAG: hypothetical protein CVU39_21010 [Chloroflexi bacterium HGW-Chloroflexi-10]|nr:MAG: hypothetical protein CVU39_21010 [Chloroflexi bacterium HGW-Chloroflexi-10]
MWLLMCCIRFGTNRLRIGYEWLAEESVPGIVVFGGPFANGAKVFFPFPGVFIFNGMNFVPKVIKEGVFGILFVGEFVHGFEDFFVGVPGFLEGIDGLGFDEAVDGGGGQGEGAQGEEGFGEIIGRFGLFEDAAHKDAQHVDLICEVDTVGGFQVGFFHRLKGFGIVAVFEGVVVAGLPAAFAFDRGWVVHRARSETGRVGDGW